jgi:glycosyltransferase involved in cell wall biosynthesis
MKNDCPEISVGMPVYNGGRYLRLAIESVLAQSYGDFELIISDNASTDESEATCREYAASDPRIVYLRNATNIGAAGNYNQLFHRSRAPYFRWFNADDLSSPRLHQECLAALQAHPGASMAYGKTELIDSDGLVTGPYEDRLNLQQESVAERFFEFLRVVGQTNAIYGLMRRSALAATALMGSGKFPAADTVLMAELALQGKIVEVPEALFFRRMHKGASSWERGATDVQQKFWLGSHGRFVMPTVKRMSALMAAVDRAPASAAERRRMKRHVLRQLVWARGAISRELCSALLGWFARRDQKHAATDAGLLRQPHEKR